MRILLRSSDINPIPQVTKSHVHNLGIRALRFAIGPVDDLSSFVLCLSHLIYIQPLALRQLFLSLANTQTVQIQTLIAS